MRALLVVNPTAHTTTKGSRDVLVRALSSEVKVDVVTTQHRGHAAALACRAAREGMDLVVALGGDGTVNEIVNGLLTDGPHANLPALGVIPGGSTNVFSRGLGQSQDPIEATAALIDALRDGRSRRIGLGRVDGRYFTFAAGFGFDAEVVHRVERGRRVGRPTSHGLYVRTALAQFFRGTDRRHPAITLELPDNNPIPGIFLAIVSNTSPWTYLGAREIRPTPRSSLDHGLDLLALRRMRSVTIARLISQLLRGVDTLRGRHLLQWHDLERFTLRAERPLAVQVDGEYLGERDRLTMASVPGALRIVT